MIWIRDKLSRNPHDNVPNNEHQIYFSHDGRKHFVVYDKSFEFRDKPGSPLQGEIKIGSGTISLNWDSDDMLWWMSESRPMLSPENVADDYLNYFVKNEVSRNYVQSYIPDPACFSRAMAPNIYFSAHGLRYMYVGGVFIL